MKILLKLIFFPIVLLFVVVCWSCQKDDNIQDVNGSLTGVEWRLSTIVDAERGPIENFERGYEMSYILILNDDKTLFGRSLRNGFQGEYKIDSVAFNIDISIGQTTLVYEPSYVYEYFKALENAHSYSIRKNELRLFYNHNGSHLLFKSK